MDKNYGMVSEAVVSGEDINAIVTKIEPVLLEVPRSHGIVACLALAITMMNPDISVENLHTGIRATSQYICMMLDSFADAESGEEIPKRLLN